MCGKEIVTKINLTERANAIKVKHFRVKSVMKRRNKRDVLV